MINDDQAQCCIFELGLNSEPEDDPWESLVKVAGDRRALLRLSFQFKDAARYQWLRCLRKRGTQSATQAPPKAYQPSLRPVERTVTAQ